MSEVKLPPLPEPPGMEELNPFGEPGTLLWYDTEQMEAYARAAVLADRQQRGWPKPPPMLKSWNLNAVEDCGENDWWVGHLNEDEVFSPVVRVDSGNYGFQEHSEPIARYLLALLTAAQAAAAVTEEKPHG